MTTCIEMYQSGSSLQCLSCPRPQRDLAALEKQVSLLSQEAKRLANTYPEQVSHVRNKEQQTLTMWKALVERSRGRKNKLVEAEQLQRFLNDFRDLRYIHNFI